MDGTWTVVGMPLSLQVYGAELCFHRFIGVFRASFSEPFESDILLHENLPLWLGRFSLGKMNLHKT